MGGCGGGVLELSWEPMVMWRAFREIANSKHDHLLDVESLDGIQFKNRLKEAMEIRTKESEKKILDLNPKLQDENFEATSKLKELTEVDRFRIYPFVSKRIRFHTLATLPSCSLMRRAIGRTWKACV